MALSDTQLLRAFVESSEEAAFAELVRRRIDFVYGSALRQVGGDRHRAADITQEVFVTLARKASSLTRHPALLGWLYTATRFAAIDTVRSEQARKVREQEAIAMETIHHEPEPEWSRLHGVLDEALTELPERDREVVLARYFDKRAYAEIGSALGLSADAAQKRVDRALDKLRVALARREVTSTTAALGLVLSAQASLAAPAGLAGTVTTSALTASAATGSAAAAGGGLLFLVMKKHALGLAAAAAIVGVGTMLVGVRADGEARHTFEVTQQAHAALSEQLAGLEHDAQAGEARVQAAEKINGELLQRAKTGEVPAAEQPLTTEMIMTRLGQARRLAYSGDAALALTELIWCYDVGLPMMSSGSGARAGLLATFASLGERHPPALEWLHARRKQAWASAQGDASAVEEFRLYTSINHALKEEATNVALLDTLPSGDPRRRSLLSLSVDYLIEHQRYKDAAEGRSFSTIQAMWNTLNRRDLPLGSDRQVLSDYRIKSSLMNLELLAGSGALDEARTYAGQMLVVDGSEKMRALMQERLVRAGQPDLLATKPQASRESP